VRAEDCSGGRNKPPSSSQTKPTADLSKGVRRLVMTPPSDGAVAKGKARKWIAKKIRRGASLDPWCGFNVTKSVLFLDPQAKGDAF
jgi:hypothetical protein